MKIKLLILLCLAFNGFSQTFIVDFSINSLLSDVEILELPLVESTLNTFEADGYECDRDNIEIESLRTIGFFYDYVSIYCHKSEKQAEIKFRLKAKKKKVIIKKLKVILE